MEWPCTCRELFPLMLTGKELVCWTIWTKTIQCFLESVALTHHLQCRFVINFKTGSSETDDIALHFLPQMGSNVIMNSFRNGGWESEESLSDNPFIKGEAFETIIVIKSEGYQVCALKHKSHCAPLKEI